MAKEEQIPLDFKGGGVKEGAEKEEREIAADDECQYCGKPFESPESCAYCRSRKEKKKKK